MIIFRRRGLGKVDKYICGYVLNTFFKSTLCGPQEICIPWPGVPRTKYRMAAIDHLYVSLGACKASWIKWNGELNNREHNKHPQLMQGLALCMIWHSEVVLGAIWRNNTNDLYKHGWKGYGYIIGSWYQAAQRKLMTPGQLSLVQRRVK